MLGSTLPDHQAPPAAPGAAKQAHGAKYTPAVLRKLGYEPIPIAPGTHRIVSRWYPGYDLDVPAGPQADGTYLYNLDLDNHTALQDAEQQLRRIRERIGIALAARLAIRRSRGNGYHIIFRTAQPFSDSASVKVYDPTHPTLHIGELIGPGLRVTLTGQWLQHGPESIPLLTATELDKLRAAIHTPELYHDEYPASPGDRCRPRRKTRIAEGLRLIAGYDRVTNPQALLDTLCAKHIPVKQQLTRHRANPEDRSKSYSALVQSLMFHATALGSTTAERCRVVAAIALHVGAAGKEQDRDYNPVQDTAVLIARILHGDPYADSLDKGFLVPYWYRYERKATTTPRHELPPPPPPARSPGRPVADRNKLATKALRWFSKIEPIGYGQRPFLVDDLAAHLRRSRRATQTILAQLRQAGEITTGQLGKNGRPYVILASDAHIDNCTFGDANNPQIGPAPAADTPTDRDASNAASDPTPMQQTPAEIPQCDKVLSAPRESAPPVVAEPAPPAGESSPAAGDRLPDLVREAFDAYCSLRAHWPAVLAHVQAFGTGAWSEQAIRYWYDRERQACQRQRQLDRQVAQLPRMQQKRLSRLSRWCDRLIELGPGTSEDPQPLYWYARRLVGHVNAELDRRAESLERVRPRGKRQRTMEEHECLQLVKEDRRQCRQRAAAAPPVLASVHHVAPQVPLAAQAVLALDAPPAIDAPGVAGLIARLKARLRC